MSTTWKGSDEVNEKRLNELMEEALNLPEDLRNQQLGSPRIWARIVAERFRDAIVADWSK